MNTNMNTSSLPIPVLEPLPLELSTNINMDNVFSYDNFAVAVNYYVLRPQKKNNC